MEKNYYKILFSIIWGLGLSSLFRKICPKNNCVVIKAPKDMDTYYQTKRKKCYSFERDDVNC
tara:strand:- start:521 stop:706 length:186 start_codon:yes stop_codon:yes gene_type:complete